MRFSFRLIAFCFIAAFFAACTSAEPQPPAPPTPEQHRVGGKSVEDVFPDTRLRALALAACANRFDEVASLIAAGADPNGEGLDGATPLIWAQSCEALAGMEALLQHGADPNKPFYDSNAVWLAANSHPVEQLALLIRYGGDVNFVANSGKTVLMTAYYRGLDGDWRNYDLLLESGVNVNYVTEDLALNGHTQTIAEMEAALNSFDRVYELLQRGYNVRLNHIGSIIEVELEDRSPIAHAQIPWRDRVREILIQRGVTFPVGPITDD